MTSFAWSSPLILHIEKSQRLPRKWRKATPTAGPPRKRLLGWDLDTEELTLQLPPHRLERLHEDL